MASRRAACSRRVSRHEPVPAEPTERWPGRGLDQPVPGRAPCGLGRVVDRRLGPRPRPARLDRLPAVGLARRRRGGVHRCPGALEPAGCASRRGRLRGADRPRHHRLDSRSRRIALGPLYLRGGTVFIAIAIFGSLSLTATARSAPLAGFWDDARPALVDISQWLQRIIPAAPDSRALGVPSFGQQVTIGGTWSTSNE